MPGAFYFTYIYYSDYPTGGTVTVLTKLIFQHEGSLPQVENAIVEAARKDFQIAPEVRLMMATPIKGNARHLIDLLTRLLPVDGIIGDETRVWWLLPPDHRLGQIDEQQRMPSAIIEKEMAEASLCQIRDVLTESTDEDWTVAELELLANACTALEHALQGDEESLAQAVEIRKALRLEYFDIWALSEGEMEEIVLNTHALSGHIARL